MPLPNGYPAEDLLMNVVHDLRQPLGTIETNTYVLRLLLGEPSSQVLQHLVSIERQLEVAARTLSEAALELRRLRTQRTDAESREFTKLETAAVT